MPLPRAVWATALIVGATLRLVGQEKPVNTAPVNLPEFNVVGERELPPPETWYYTRIAGQEVLSSASRSRTEQMARDVTRVLHALDLTGTTLLPRNKAATRMLITGREGNFSSFAPELKETDEDEVWSAMLGGPENPVLIINERSRSLGYSAEAESGDDESGPEAATPAERAADAARHLQVGYFRAVLSRQRPALPAWFIEGVAQMLARVRITDHSVTLGYVENQDAIGKIGGQDREAGHSVAGDLKHRLTPAVDSLADSLDFNAALARSGLFSLPELFAANSRSFPGEENIKQRIRWEKQCHAFVHWGLFGDYGRHEKQFLAFMQRLQTQPLTEKLFQESLGMNYAEGLAALRTHVEVTRVKVVGVKADKDQKLPPEPPIEVREATPLEVARLKSIAFAAGHQPEKAREELILAYRRGERSPDLVAELGLAELNLGRREQAARYLALATKAKCTRPRAYAALARIRLEDRVAKPQGKDGKLSYEQLLGVLEPLLLARTQAPRTPEIYTLFAEAWARADAPMPPQHLALVDEGVTLFPEDTALREARARLGPTATAK